ncbi:MAG: glycerophosphodiester phosphodiesterase family protein [Pseudomonadales bacterium]
MSVTAFQADLKPMSDFPKTIRNPERGSYRCLLFGLILLSCSTPSLADNGFGHWSAYLSDTPLPQPNRALYLASKLTPGPLRQAIESCDSGLEPHRFSIAHRGAPALFPEHTRESYLAAARQGAGVIECDVTFTKDGELVCRHSQCDLHRTTNILETPLREKCRTPFRGAGDDQPASVECCTSDLTLAEFRSLCGKHDTANPDAKTRAGYMHGARTLAPQQYPGCGTLMTLSDSIELISRLDRAHAPELKAADAQLPYSQTAYAQLLIDHYNDHNIAPENVFVQSFNPEDVAYWLRAAPEFGRQALLLDSRDAHIDIKDPSDPGVAGVGPSFAALRAMGVRFLAPPLYFLIRNENGVMVPSDYAKQARAAGLQLVAWTLERSGPIADLIKHRDGRTYYYRTVVDALKDEGDVLRVLHLLASEVGVSGVFSDWPETTTTYANCVLER